MHAVAVRLLSTETTRPQALKLLEPQLDSCNARLIGEVASGKLPFLNLPFRSSLTARLKALTPQLRRFKHMVVLGIGGSALGPIAVHQALNHLHYNELPKEKRNGPRLHVEDNADPERMAALLLTKEAESAHVTYSRHIHALAEAKAGLETADAAMGTDLAAADIRTALYALGQITGREVTADVIERIFSRFCVGK